MSMVNIVPVCCVSWLNKVLNSVRKAESVPRDQQAGDRGRRHGNMRQKGVWGVVQGVECGVGEESGDPE